jgi:hypothetical protein
MLFDYRMRALAHDTVDALFDHVGNIAGRRVVNWQTSDELRERITIDDRGGAEGMALIRTLMENAIQLHHPAYMGHQVFNIFCFRHKSDDETNTAIRERLIRSGQAWITSTLLKGRSVLRVTMINPRTERGDVDRMMSALRTMERMGVGE